MLTVFPINPESSALGLIFKEVLLMVRKKDKKSSGSSLTTPNTKARAYPYIKKEDREFLQQAQAFENTKNNLLQAERDLISVFDPTGD